MPEAEKMKRRGCRLLTLAWTGQDQLLELIGSESKLVEKVAFLANLAIKMELTGFNRKI